MLTNVAIGTLMVVLTTAIHSVGMIVTFRMLANLMRREGRAPGLSRLMAVTGTVLLLFAASLVEVSAWATAFVLLGAISGLEPALYFSTVTFTTLGYGDTVLDERWRLLSSFAAMNGIIMFGWTTALVIAVVQRTYAPVVERYHPVVAPGEDERADGARDDGGRAGAR